MAALGELFAPAYVPGNQQSIDAVDAWMAKNYSMTNPKVEQTRSPVAFNTGNAAGMVDPEALRVLAQGGPYDASARRDAIAAQVAANAAAASSSASSAPASSAAPPQVYVGAAQTSTDPNIPVFGFPYGGNMPSS